LAGLYDNVAGLHSFDKTQENEMSNPDQHHSEKAEADPHQIFEKADPEFRICIKEMQIRNTGCTVYSRYNFGNRHHKAENKFQIIIRNLLAECTTSDCEYVIWNYLSHVVAGSGIETRRSDAPFWCVREAATGTGMLLLLTAVVWRRTAQALYVDEQTVTRMMNFETV
jgi:hypothetical protein